MKNLSSISFRELPRISSREVLARRLSFDTDRLVIDPNKEGLSTDIREALTVTDSGRQIELAGNTSEQIRIALAQNPHLSGDVQVAMSRGTAGDKAKAMLARNPVTIEPVQKTLSKGHVEVRKALAENPKLSPDVQVRMARKPKESEEVIESLYKNPNLVWAAASILLPKLNLYARRDLFQRNKTLEFQKNVYRKLVDAKDTQNLAYFFAAAPLVPEMQQTILRDMRTAFENPERTDLLKLDTWRALAQNPECGDVIKIVLLDQMDATNAPSKTEYTAAIAKTAKTQGLIDRMLDAGFKLSVAQNPNLNTETTMRLLNLGDQVITSDIAKTISQKSSVEIIPNEIADKIIEMRNTQSIINIVAKLSIESQGKAIEFAKEKLVGTWQINDFFANISRNIAKHPGIGLLAAEFGDMSSRVSSAKTSTSEQTQMLLLKGVNKKDFYSYDRQRLIQALAENPALAPAVRHEMISNLTAGTSVPAILKLPQLTEDELNILFAKMASTGFPEVYEAFKSIALYQKLPASIQEQIIRFASTNSDIGSGVLIALAQNPVLSPALQTQFVDESKEWASQDASISIAQRKDITPEALAILSHSSFEKVKRTLLENPATPENVKAQIKNILQVIRDNKWGDDYYGYNREREGATQPALDTQNELFAMNDPLMSRLLAKKSSAPEILDKFIDQLDKPVIAQALAENPAISISIQTALFSLQKENIDEALIRNPKVDGALKIRILDRTNENPERKSKLLGELLEQGFAPRKVQLDVYEASKGKELEPGRRNRLSYQFRNLVQLKNLEPDIQMEIAKSKKGYVRSTLSENPNLSEAVQKRLALDKLPTVRTNLSRLENLSESAQRILVKDSEHSIRKNVYRNRNLAQDIQLELAQGEDEDLKNSLAENPSIKPEIIMILADPRQGIRTRAIIARKEGLDDGAQEMISRDPEPQVREQLAVNPSINAEAQKALSTDSSEPVRWNLARNSKINADTQRTLASDSNTRVIDYLSRNQNLLPEIKIRTQSKPPAGFNKNEFIARVHKNKYVFRVLEKYMEDNSLTQLESQKFKGSPIERFRQQPLVDAMFKENNGKPLTLEHIKKAIEKMEAKEFYIFHNTFGSGIQSHDTFRHLPRYSFALLFKDLEGDPETLQFMKDVAPKLAHGQHGSMGGWGAMNMGWILWKDISTVTGRPSVLIEQIQSDWRGLMSKIRAIKDDIDNPSSRAAGIMLEEWNEKHGEESLGRIQKNLDELVKDYPEKLMAEFLTNSGVRGKTVYITGRDTQQRLVGHQAGRESVMLDTIYERMPAAFGFKQAEDLPGFLKLERANTKYRKIIRQAAEKLIKESFELGGLDSLLKDNIRVLGNKNVSGFKAVPLYGEGLNRMAGTEGKIIKQNGTTITIQSKSGVNMIDLAKATYLRVDEFREEVRFSMDPH